MLLLKTYYYKRKRNRTMSNEQLYIYTIGSDETKMEYLKMSAQIANIEIHVEKIQNWTGYVDKITHMINLLENHPNQDDLICFIDAYDVLCFSGLKEIIHKFKEYNCKILLSSELNCYPPQNLYKYEFVEYQMQEFLLNDNIDREVFPTNFKYVNSGGYIGYCRELLKMLRWKSIEEITEICKDGGDQTYISLYYLEHAVESFKTRHNNNLPYGVQIDYNQTIFQSMYKIDFTDFFFINGRLYNKILKTQPCFAHFNGYKIYDEKIVSLETTKEDNVYDVFLNKITCSLQQSDRIHSLNYRVLFYIFYNGQYQYNLPQINNPINNNYGSLRPIYTLENKSSTV